LYGSPESFLHRRLLGVETKVTNTATPDLASLAKIIPSMAAAAETRPILSEATNLPTVQAFTDNPEFDLLIACCAHSSHKRHANRIPQILARPIDWDRMLGLVDYHRVVPQVYRELSAFSHLVPAEQLDALRLRYQDNARKTLWFTAELVGMLNHLESAGIEALPYKGPVLAETLYGEVTQRQFGDLDILILLSDVPKAKATLLRLGYSCEPDLCQQEEPAYIATGCGYVFHSPAVRNLLDLQWRIVPRFYAIDFDVAAFLERADEIVVASVATQAPLKKHNETSWNSREAAPECSPRRKPWVENETRLSPSGAPDQDKNQPQPSLGRPMRTLRGEDLLLVLCVHAAKHVWVQLSWLCDIAQLTKSRQLDWNAIQDEASRLGIERIVNLNLLLAHKLLAASLPPQIQERLQDDPFTTVLADDILRIIESSVHYDTESLPYFRLMLRLRERWQDRARFLWRLAVTPSVSEWSAVQLPKPLRPLYRLVRLSRLTKRLASAG
jgi:hypothetical protein